MVTDVVHFQDAEHPGEVTLLAIAILAALIFMSRSLEIMERLIRARFTAAIRSNLIMLNIFLLSGYGVYLGRIPRFNSWDIIIKPEEIARIGLETFGFQSLAFGALFASIEFCVYRVFYLRFKNPVILAVKKHPAVGAARRKLMKKLPEVFMRFK
jgi:uncharacterized membrane protein